MILPVGSGPIADGGDSLSPPTVGIASCPVEVSVVGYGATALPVRVSVVSAAVADGGESVADGGTTSAIWGVIVEVGGVDVTNSVIGEVVVEAEEGAARIADLSLHVSSGTAITVTAWIGRRVLIQIADMSSGVPIDSLPLFNGIVDLPTITPRSGIIALRCTDSRQGIIGGLSREEIAALITGSRYSPVVFDNGASSAVFAEDLLSTVPAALDMSPGGDLRLTPWKSKAVADLSFDDSVVLQNSVSVDISDRSRMTNRVDISFGYRFPRVKAEGYQVDYNFLELYNTSFGYWVEDGNSFIQRASVVRALEKTGGSVVGVYYIPLPTTAQSLPRSGGYWLPNPATDPQLCLGFSAVVSFDYAQTIEEQHQITVVNAASVAALGTVATSMSCALEGVYDDTVAVEQSMLLYRQEVTRVPPKNLAPIVVGLTNSLDATLTEDSDRSAADAAMETLISIANTTIAQAHRQHQVGFSVPCAAVIDIDKTVEISAGGVVAKGKVRRVVHRLNAESGSAISSVDLAICSLTGTGIEHAGDAVVAPGGTEDGPTNTLGAPEVTWNGMYLEDGVLTIALPGVEEAERAKSITTINSSYMAPLVEDILEVET